MRGGVTFTVVGSGASAVHFAQTALEGGHRVRMLDVGHERPAPVLPQASLTELKERLDDPAAYFLGDDLASVVLPDLGDEYYGFPPSKAYVFAGVAGQDWRARGFEPLRSFARGGLAEAWTGGAYPFDDGDLAAFPFGLAELLPHYERVARRIGVSGAADDLARFLPVHAHLQPPLELDEHGRRLLEGYRSRRARLNALGCHVGRSRLATLSRDHAGRAACDRLGRCLWGCPSDSLYAPSHTLAELRRREGFEYAGGRLVTGFDLDDGGRVTAVRLRRPEGGAEEREPVERLVLAAGTLSTARIYLASLARAGGGPAPALRGLMDNRQVMLPYVNLGLIGRPWEPRSYQYHQLNMSLAGDGPGDYVHGQVTTLKTALIHPIVQGVPLDLRTAAWVFKHVHAALGLVNVNFHDTPRPENTVTLECDGAEELLAIDYTPAPDEAGRIQRALKTYRRALRLLGCVVPPGMTHTRPMGASVHYAGTLPMTNEERAHTLTPEGRVRGMENLLVVDGSALPWLPAKNLTFTLMANASRVAEVGP